MRNFRCTVQAAMTLYNWDEYMRHKLIQEDRGKMWNGESECRIVQVKRGRNR
jgi:hypothetical protein